MKKLILICLIPLFSGCVSQPFAKALVGIAQANTQSKANIEVHVITPQGTLDYKRTILP
jgi:PBP1b-binding outer membrane lipoprotein LpoB